MAGFQDELIQFNPYIKELPVDDMVRVGMIKQEQYNQGVQKIQATWDSIAGMDVIKDEHKQYLDGMLNQLQTETSKVLGSDLSRTQLQSQVGGLARKIGADPIIQNAVMSTQKIRKAQAALQEAKTTGKGYSVENEYAFNDQLNKFLGDKDATSSFGGEYIPYVDVKKKIMEVIKTVDPSSTLTQVPFQTDAAGNIQVDASGQPIIDYAMVERSVKGKSPEQLLSAIQMSLDENDLRQIGITGKFHYRNYTPEDMKKTVDANVKARGNKLISDIDTLKIEIASAEGEEKTALEDQLSLLQENLQGLNKEYTSTINTLSSDPDGFKQNFYAQNLLNGMSQAFSSSEISNKFVNNPKWDGWVQDQNLKIAQERLKLDWEKLSIDKAAASAKANKADKTKENEISSAANPYPVSEDDYFKSNEFAFEQETANIIGQKDDLITKAVSTIIPLQESIANARSLGQDPQVYREAMFEQFVDRYRKGENVPDEMVSTIKNVLELRRDIDTRKGNIARIKSEADKMYPEFQNVNLANTVSPEKVSIRVGGDSFWQGGDPVDVELDNQDIINLGIINKNVGFFGSVFTSRDQDQRARVAKQALISKFGEKVGSELAANAEPGDISAFGGAVREKMRTISKALGNKGFAERQQLIENRLNETGRIGAPVSFDIRTGKGEDEKNIQNQAASIIQDLKLLGGGPTGADKTLETAFSKEGASYKVVWQPKGENNPEKYQLLVVDREGETTPVPITQRRAEQLTGRVFDSKLNAIQTKIATSGTNSTNTTNKPDNAFLHDFDFPRTKKYRISGDVSSSVNNPDEYFLKIHIPTPEGGFITRPARLKNQKEGGLTLTEIQNLMANMTDAEIEVFLKNR